MSELPPDVARLVAALDAVLVPHGFAAAQGGVDLGRGQLIWCCSGEDWADRFPHLPPSRSQLLEWGGPAACVDVTADLALSARGWVVVEVRVEGLSLADVLDGQGRSLEAGRVQGLDGRPVVETLDLLPAVLRGLLGPAHRGRGQEV